MKTVSVRYPCACFTLKQHAPGTCLGSEGGLNLKYERLNRYFFSTGTTLGQPEAIASSFSCSAVR